MIRVRFQKRGGSLVGQVIEHVAGRQRHVAYLGSVRPKSYPSRQAFWDNLLLRVRRGELRKLRQAERDRILRQVEETVARPKQKQDRDTYKPTHGDPLLSWVLWWMRSWEYESLEGLRAAFEDPAVVDQIVEDMPNAGLQLVDTLTKYFDALPPQGAVETLRARLEGVGSLAKRKCT
jgi:hypothetical protein